MIILFYGQPASGKTTLANAFYESTNDKFWSFIRIDGDKWREVTNNKDYTIEGRIKNLMSAFNMALYLERDGYIPILSFVTPYEQLREHLRTESKNLIEIYLEYNEDRGRNNNFASDFEKPDISKIIYINTSEKSIQESLEYINEKINFRNYNY